MRDLWRLFEKCIEHKLMLRFSVHPGGAVHVAIYYNDEQYLYDGKIEDIERSILCDFVEVFGPIVRSPHVSPRAIDIPGNSRIPLPPGFPKP